MDSSVIVEVPAASPLICEGFPAERRVDLEAFNATLATSERPDVEATWQRLHPLIDRVKTQRAEVSKTVGRGPWQHEVLMQFVTREKRWDNKLKEPDVQREIERAHRLLEVYCGATVPRLVIRLFKPPRQVIRENLAADVDAAVHVEERFRAFLKRKVDSRDGRGEPGEVIAGACCSH